MRKLYYEANKEANKEKYNAQNKLSYEANKVEVTCNICGTQLFKKNLRRHQKTKKCQSFLQNKEEGNEQDVHE